MTKAIGQVHSVQTFDQQLYAIAKQGRFKKEFAGAGLLGSELECQDFF
jgi:hypothetical protein